MNDRCFCIGLALTTEHYDIVDSILLRCFYSLHIFPSSKAGYYITHTKASVPLLSPPKTVDVIYFIFPRPFAIHQCMLRQFHIFDHVIWQDALKIQTSLPLLLLWQFLVPPPCAHAPFQKHIHPPLNKKDLTHIGGSALQCNTRITMINNVIKCRGDIFWKIKVLEALSL